MIVSVEESELESRLKLLAEATIGDLIAEVRLEGRYNYDIVIIIIILDLLNRKPKLLYLLFRKPKCLLIA